MNELPLIVHGFQWESHRNFPWVMCQSYVLLTGQNLTHPKAKTSDCLEKGSWSSAVSGESWQTISGARWQSQPLGIRSLSSLLLQKERNTDKQKPFEPSKLNPFYFPSCIRVSEACANNLPKTPLGGGGWYNNNNQVIIKEKEIAKCGVKVFNTNWVLFFTCCSVFISKWHYW